MIDDLPLFSSARAEASRRATDLGLRASDSAAAKRAAIVTQLVALARAIAGERTDGITVSDLRVRAVEDGILTGREDGRELSFLGSVMRKAGLVNTGRTERSYIEKTHGNLQTIWALPTVAA